MQLSRVLDSAIGTILAGIVLTILLALALRVIEG